MLRGVAAMLVVFNHAGLFLVLAPQVASGPSWLAPSEAVARTGAFGVDLFFIISGFVMALSAPRFAGVHGARTFLMLRFVRIAPLYYLACLAILVAVTDPGMAIERESLLNSVTFIPFFDDVRYSWPVHYLGWTLAFEFVFYVVVAACVAAGIAARPLVLLATLACLPLLGVAVAVDLALWRVVTNPILWEFGLGVLAYVLWRRGWLARLALPLGVAFGVAVAAIGLALWQSPESVATLSRGTINGSNSALRALCWGVPAFLCFATLVGWTAARGGAAARAGVATRVMKTLGDASYSIYLSHLGLVMVLQKVVARVALPGDVVVVGTLVLSAVVGVAVYRTVEAPLVRVGQQAVRHLMQGAGRAARPVATAAPPMQSRRHGHF
jgi:peptidoglycan/LPS O-acetylase OafA/YrhL